MEHYLFGMSYFNVIACKGVQQIGAIPVQKYEVQIQYNSKDCKIEHFQWGAERGEQKGRGGEK